MERPGMKSNGEASGGSTSGSRAGQTTQPRSDIYKQLINNDMVKELDDIEAISQQIFQHAEVLHNSWKHNGMSQGPQFKLSAAQQVSPSVEQHSVNPLSLNLRERGGFLSPTTPPSSAQSNGCSSLKQPSHYTRQAGYSDTGSNSYNSWPRGGPGQESQSSSVSSPASSTRESPARGSSVTQINNNSEAVGPLELLASPNLNGNLEDLVSSFVSTDRAKQAARNTISSTLMRRIGSPTNGSSPSASPGPTSPTATLNYRGASPLRSPMLTSSAPMSSPFSGGDNDVHTPMQSIFSSSRSPSTAPSSSSSSSSSNSMRTPPSHISSPLANKPMQSKNDIHSPMQSMFSHSSKPSSNFNNGHSSKLAPLHINTDKDKPDGSIPIPVKHIPINKAPAISSSAAAAPPADALKSPSVLQSASSSAKQNPFLPTTSQSMSRPGTDQHAPMPNLFDEFGAVNDAKFLEMRRRFEEAKQRMALSLPAREGGVRPNSFGSMALWDSPWGEDSSAFLLEQFRRRNKRRMEMPSAPHPELTPEQKQHISDRSSSLMQAGTPLRRMYPGGRPGGSVAERVLMFEKSPSAFGVEPVQVRVPQRREPQLTGHIISGTPWKSSLQESAVNKVQNERIVPINRVDTSQPQSQPQLQLQSQKSLKTPEITPAPVSSSSSAAPASSSSTPSPPERLLPSQWQPPPPVTQTFPRRTQIPSPHFRPPSLHLPGKEEIPKFYFPNGNPTGKLSVDAICKKFSEAFSKNKNTGGGGVSCEQLGQVLKTSGYPLYWKCPVFQSAGGDKVDTITLLQLTKAWKKLATNCHDDAAQFISFLTQGSRNYLVPEDFVPLIQDVVDTHPGLLFLKEATEFHSRYVHTVIARIFYEVNRSWSGKITVSELRRSKFLSTLKLLQDEDDINQVTDFFSYEHFYVIYCKFWELDKDHDLFIDREDLSRHNEHALSTRMIERIFSGAVTRGSAQKEGRMSYTEFVWFLLSEEDKRHPTAIEYWFRCMDLDGDGVLSMYELEFFYEEQLQRMEQLGIETLPFDDCLCQMLDMIRPAEQNRVTLKDLKRCKMTPVFFDTFFNLEKYLDHEQRDPFATQREVDEDGNELSDWDRFAADEYEQLVAEEGSGELIDDMCYDEENPNDNLNEVNMDKN